VNLRGERLLAPYLIFILHAVRFNSEAVIRGARSIGRIGLQAAFRTAAHTPDTWLIECRLSPSAHGSLASAENGHFQPIVKAFVRVWL
jgi:hypothetical protein